jgi:hypothetical protein
MNGDLSVARSQRQPRVSGLCVRPSLGALEVQVARRQPPRQPDDNHPLFGPD